MVLPVVYLAISKGKATCTGIKGIAIRPKRSFGIPPSTNFRPITLSVVEKPIWKKKTFALYVFRHYGYFLTYFTCK